MLVGNCPCIYVRVVRYALPLNCSASLSEISPLLPHILPHINPSSNFPGEPQYLLDGMDSSVIMHVPSSDNSHSGVKLAGTEIRALHKSLVALNHAACFIVAVSVSGLDVDTSMYGALRVRCCDTASST